MIKRDKIIITITVFFNLILVDKLWAQGLEIGGTASFSYTTSNVGETGKSVTTQDLDEKFTQSYSLNVKTDLTSEGSVRSSVRYSADESIKSRGEALDLGVDLSYRKMAFSLTWNDDIKQDLDAANISNAKSNSFNFRLNPDDLPDFSFSYRNSINNNDASSLTDSNSYSLSISKSLKILDSNLSASASYADNKDNITGKQLDDERFNLSYSIRLFEEKVTINTGYRVGSNYDLSNSNTNLSESGDVNVGLNFFKNLTLTGDWAKSRSFSSGTGKEDIKNDNGFRLNYIPFANFSISASIRFAENQGGDNPDNTTSKDFSLKLPPIFEAITVGYSYRNKETKDTLTEDDSIDFDLDLGSLDIKDFKATARYGNRKRNTFDTHATREEETFNLGVSGLLAKDLIVSYDFGADKTISNTTGDNKDSIRNSVRLSYAVELIEDLRTSMGTSYSNSQTLSAASSTIKTDNSIDGSLVYKLFGVDMNVSGSLSRSFDNTGTANSHRTEWGPRFSTKIKELSITTSASFKEDTSNEGLESAGKSYAISLSYPFFTKGSSNLSYTVDEKEDLKSSLGNKYSEKISVGVSLGF